MFIYRSIIILCLLWICNVSDGQERLGLALSNFGGPHSLLINPSANIGSPIGWQVNIISAGVFVENNYLYIEDATVPAIIRFRNSIGPSQRVEPEGNPLDYDLTYDFSTSSRDKFVTVNTDLMGPAFTVHRNHHSFGVFTRARAILSIKDVPDVLNFYNLQDLEDEEVLNVNSGSIGAMAWTEIGVNYARRISRNRTGSFDLGGNLKFLQGFEANYFTAPTNHVIINAEDYMEFRNLNVQSGFASSINNGNTPAVLGYGAALDVGLTYKRRSNDEKMPYRWKVGASIKDFGLINFKKNAAAHSFTMTDSIDINKSLFDGAENRTDLYSTFSELVYGDPTASQTSDQFGMWLPFAFSIQAEYAINQHIYINAIMVRDIPLPIPGVRAENIWALTPRYETRWFEFNLPLFLYNDNDLRLGASLKMGYLTIGSDNLNSFMVKEQETGTDIYVALKVNPSQLFEPNRKNFNGFGTGGRRSKTSGCFDF